jgi:hypothetical protein
MPKHVNQGSYDNHVRAWSQLRARWRLKQRVKAPYTVRLIVVE